MVLSARTQWVKMTWCARFAPKNGENGIMMLSSEATTALENRDLGVLRVEAFL
jgi:hypothetical protein